MFPSLSERRKIGSWSLSQKIKPSLIFFYLLILFLPTQFGKHFWPGFSYVYGIRTDYLSPTLYLTDIFIVLIFITFVIEIFREKKLYLSSKKIKTYFLKLFITGLFFLILVIGVLKSHNPYAGLYGLAKILEYLFLFSYTAKNFRKLSGLILFSSFIIGIVSESVLAIAQYINQGSIGGALYFLGERSFNSQTPGVANASINGELILRPYATFPHPNVLAAYIFIFMALTILFIKHGFLNSKKIILLPVLVLGSFALLLTMSRTVLVAWGVVLVFLLSHSFLKKTRIDLKKKINFKIGTDKILIVLFFLICIFSFILPIGPRFSQLNFSDQTVVQREILIKDSIVMFYRQPVFGVGLNNFLINLPDVQKQQKESLYIQPVHNIFLLIVSQAGILVFTLFLYFLIKTYIRIKDNKDSGLLVLFISVLFLGFFDHYFLTLQQGQLIFTILFGIFWSNSKKDDKIKI